MSDLETNWEQKNLTKFPALMRPFFDFIDKLMSSAFGFRVGSEEEKLFFSIFWEQLYGAPLFIEKTNVVIYIISIFQFSLRIPRIGVMLEAECSSVIDFMMIWRYPSRETPALDLNSSLGLV